MTKKLISAAIVVVMSICLLGALAACSGGSQSENADEHTHTYGEWTTVQSPTCVTDGKREKVCTVCGKEQEETLAALGHLPQTAVIENEIVATCEENGRYDEVVYCERCNDELSREEKTVAALGHDLVHHAGKKATCTESGWREYDACTRCDYITYEEISAKGHIIVTDKAVPPTCTETGLTEGKHCSVCGKIFAVQEEVAALGHDMIHHEAQNPTCTEIGWNEYDECSRCDYTTYEEIPAMGHTEVIDKAVPPTCTETGLTEGKRCSVCGEVLVAQEEVAALGHDMIHHEEQNSTWTEIGWTD
ncbi:MAG: hypothetical protein IJ735_03565 [Clostridia bacterium]|nr:hypothetical protein [Clostridia bacterium]